MRPSLKILPVVLNVLWKIVIVFLLASIAVDIHDMASALYDDVPEVNTSSAPKT